MMENRIDDKQFYKDSYCACIWPKAIPTKNMEYILNEIQNIGTILKIVSIGIPKKQYKYLICQIYSDDEWIGNSNNKFWGSKRKGNNCYCDGENTYFVFFKSNADTQKRIEIKETIRTKLGVGKHSIHITDTIDEVFRIAQIVLNPNSLDFIIKGRPDRYPIIERIVMKFNSIANRRGIDRSEYIFDSSVILGMYGIRKPRDIDFLTMNSNCMNISGSRFDCHNNSATYEKSIADLIEDHNNYFIWQENKYMILDDVIKSKLARGEKHDLWDVDLAKAYINDSVSVGTQIKKIAYDIFTDIRRCKNIVAYILKKAMHIQ